MPRQRGRKITGEDTAGKPPQEPPSPQNLRCFQDILDIVFSLTDREWRTLSEDVPHAGTKLQFASLCTKIIVSASKSAVQSYLPSLLRVVGMEAVLTAEEKLRKKAESASINPSGSSTAEENSDKRSPVDPSDLICHIVEDFVSEVKMAMQESICKVASCKESSWSKDWKTTCSLVAKEMLKILKGKMRHSQHQDSKDLREAQDESESDTDALTGKIIVVVLDVLEGNSSEHKTSDLLRATAERLFQTASTSEVEKTVFVDYRKQNVRLAPEELQTKATRAVSQLLLSNTGVWDMSSSSPEMPSSLASETDLDSMLEAMARSGFPTDLMQSHLDATSRDIVHTIQGNIDMFSSTSPSTKIRKVHRPLSSDTAKESMMSHIFHRINEKVKMFFNVFNQFMKKRSTKLQQNTVPTSSPSQTSLIDDLTVSCTNDVIGGITHLYHADVLSSDSHRSTGGKISQLSMASKLRVHRVTQELEKMITSSRSSSKRSLECTDLEESKDISSPESVIVNKEAGSVSSPSLQRIESLFSGEFQEKATQVVSDALLKTCGKVSAAVSVHSSKEGSDGVILTEVDMPESQPVPSYSSSVLVESAASDITKTFLDGLQKTSSDQVDHESMTEPSPSPKTFHSAARRLYRNVQYKIFGFLLRLQESQSGKESLLTSSEFGTNNQRLKPAESLQIDDSKIPPRNQADINSCTDDIIYNVLDLYKKEVQLVESSSSEKCKVIKSASLRSSDQNDEGVLEKQKVHEFSSSNVVPVLYQPEVNTSTVTSEGFLTKAIQVVSDILVKSASQQVSFCASSQHDPCTGPCSSSTSSKSSSRDLHGAAVDVAEIVVDALDKLVESSVITSKSDSETIIRSLVALPVEPSAKVLSTFDVSASGSHSAPLNLFERVQGYLQALYMTCFESQTICSTQGDLQPPTVHSVSYVDDLTVTCTNSIISEVVHRFHSDASPECQAPTGDEDSVKIYDIFQGLGELARSSKSSSKTSASGSDLREFKDRLFPELDSDFKDTALGCTSSYHSVESLFSAQFQSKATQTVGEILLKSVEKLPTSGFTQSFQSPSSSTAILPSVAASSLSIQAESTASDIIRSFLKYLQKCCLSVPSDNTYSSSKTTSKQKESVPSASRSIYRGVQKKVFGFLLGLQTSFSERSKIFPQDQPTGEAELEPESVLSVRSPPHITSARIQINLDSCADEVIGKVVELYKSELLLSSSSEVPLHISTSLPEQPFRLKTVKPKSFQTDAVKLVSDVLVKKASSQTSSLFLDSSRQTSPILSTASKDLQNAAVTIAEEVVGALDRYVESRHSAMATVNSSCERLSCLDALSRISVSNVLKEPDTSGSSADSEPFFIFRKVKDLVNNLFMGADRQRISHKCISTEENQKISETIQATPNTSHHSMSTISRKTPSSSLFAVSERPTDPEYNITEKSDSAAKTLAVPQPQSLQQMNQLQHPISDETIRCHADKLTNFEVLRYIKGPPRVWKRSSDSVLETSWVRNNLLRDPVQVPSSLVYVFVDESVKTLLLHLLSLNSASSRVAGLSTTSAGSKELDRHSLKSAGSQCAFTDAESRLTKVLTDSQSRTEDPLLLLVDSEQTKPERNQDVSLLDVKSPAVSPTTSSRASSTMVKETLDNRSISSQDFETYSSSSSPLNEHRSSDPKPVAVKKSSRGFRFIVCKKAPVFSLGVKKSSKVCPTGMMSDHHQSTSSSGNLQKSEQRESAFRKTRKRLSRIFTAIRKALPNPFHCMTPPS